MIEGFDYKQFAQDLTGQAAELVPPDFSAAERDYVANTLMNFASIAGEALSNDTESNFNAEQAIMITQIIAEWSFHKSVDLVRSGLPQQYWDPIMQKIAFTIFEVAKQAFKQNIPQDQVLQLIEHHVKKTYAEAVQDLKDKDLIDDGLMDQAINQSNIDSMMQQQAQQEAVYEQQMQDPGAPAAEPMPEIVEAPPQEENPRVLKLATLALLFKQMKQDKVQSIISKFSEEDAGSVIKFMGLPDLEQKVDTDGAIRCLEEIRSNIPAPDGASPALMLKRIKAVSDKMNRKKLEQMLALERKNVQRFVFKAVEGEYMDFAPKVANILVAHLESAAGIGEPATGIGKLAAEFSAADKEANNPADAAGESAPV